MFEKKRKSLEIFKYIRNRIYCQRRNNSPDRRCKNIFSIFFFFIRLSSRAYPIVGLQSFIFYDAIHLHIIQNNEVFYDLNTQPTSYTLYREDYVRKTISLACLAFILYLEWNNNTKRHKKKIRSNWAVADFTKYHRLFCSSHFPACFKTFSR